MTYYCQCLIHFLRLFSKNYYNKITRKEKRIIQNLDGIRLVTYSIDTVNNNINKH